MIAGHGRTELAEAAHDQMTTLGFVSGYTGSSNLRAIELAERLAAIAYPSINRFFFTSGGAEANETAIKIARSYWKLNGKPAKTKVISRQLGYHGVTLAAMSATGISAYWPRFEPRVPGFVHIPSPYPYRYRGSGVAAANELEQAILREGADTVAMFLAEPVQGVGGVIVPQDDYFARIRAICNQHEVLFAADEVITGFGRTGHVRARALGRRARPRPVREGDHLRVLPARRHRPQRPDRDDLDSDQRRGCTRLPTARTRSAATSLCACSRSWSGIALPARAATLGQRLLERLRAAIGDHPNVGDIRGLGLMCAVEFVQDATRRRSPGEREGGRAIDAEAMQRGLFSRNRADIYMLAPPFIVTTARIDRMVDIVDESVRVVLGT